jgi:peptidoglycan/xylan/chitin deacetylase (PgdA/CDA1 family)
MMLRDPERWDYSAIVDRPPLTLPGGAKLAVWVVSNHEFYEFNPPLRDVRKPWPRVQPDTLSYGYRDYGNRVGIWRVMELLDRYEIRASISLNVAVCDHHPEITEASLERGWEFYSHGIYNTRYLFGMPEAEERQVIEDSIATIEKATGSPPVGWLSPALTNTERTLDLLAEYGFTYTCDLFHDDQPFPVKVKSGRLASIPYTLDLNDVIVYNSFLYTGRHYGEMIRDQFDVLYEEATRTGSGRVMCVSLHPYLVGQPNKLAPLDDALAHIRGHDDVWFATGQEIADWYLEHDYDDVVASLVRPEASA